MTKQHTGCRVAAPQPALSRFQYKQVQLDDSPLLQQLVRNRSLYMDMSEDQLLKPFRVLARQAAPGGDMGGWYDASDDFHIDASDFSTANWHGYIPGHSFGQYVSGLARCYAAAGDPRIKAKLARLVEKYAETIHPRFFAGYPLQAYTYDKLVIGLVDAYQYAGIAQAKPALDRLTDVALPFLPERALTREERRVRPYTQEAEIWDETYTLPEHLFLAWRAGMGERYKELALRYLQDEALFDAVPTAAGTGTHHRRRIAGGAAQRGYHLVCRRRHVQILHAHRTGAVPAVPQPCRFRDCVM